MKLVFAILILLNSFSYMVTLTYVINTRITFLSEFTYKDEIIDMMLQIIYINKKINVFKA